MVLPMKFVNNHMFVSNLFLNDILKTIYEKEKTSEKECRQRYHVIFIIFYHKYMNLMLQFICPKSSLCTNVRIQTFRTHLKLMHIILLFYLISSPPFEYR